MNYANLIEYDIANGEGVRTSLFVSGCTNDCPGCFNKEQQDFSYGRPFSVDTQKEIEQLLRKSYVSGLSILGGEPLCQDIQGISRLQSLCKYAHKQSKNVWLWTGYKWENIPHLTKDMQLQQKIFDLITECDVVVDGPFVKELYSPVLKWRGSSNQRVIDVQKTLQNENNKIVLHKAAY